MIWYVATLSRYELVEAGTADEARRVGEARMPGRPVRTVRPATGDEIALTRYDERMRRGLGPCGQGVSEPVRPAGDDR